MMNDDVVVVFFSPFLCYPSRFLLLGISSGFFLYLFGFDLFLCLSFFDGDAGDKEEKTEEIPRRRNLEG